MIIEGKTFLINSLEEIPAYKIRLSSLLSFIWLVFSIPIIVLLLYMLYKESIVNNPDRFDQIWSTATFFLTSIIMVFGWWIVIKVVILDASKYRSWWVINGKGLYAEKDDDPDLEFKLKELKERLAVNSSLISNPKKNWFDLNTPAKLTALICFSLLLIFSINILERYNTFLVISIVFFSVLFGILAIKHDIDKLRWK